MKIYNKHDRAGCVQLRRSRKTGTMIGVYHSEQAGLDPDGGAWSTICEKHGTICNHETLKLAKDHAPYVEWCEDCSAPEPALHPTIIEKLRGWHSPAAFCISLTDDEAQQYVDLRLLERMPGELRNFGDDKPSSEQAYRLTEKALDAIR